MEQILFVTAIVLIVLITIIIYFRRQIRWLLNLNVLLLKSLVFDKDQVDSFANIRIFGDSIAFGLGSNNSKNTFYGYFKKRFKGCVISDHSDIGSYLGQLVRFLRRHDYEQDISVVWVGSMDVLFGLPWTYERKITKILDTLSGTSKHVIFFSPPDTVNLVFFPKLVRKFLSWKSRNMHKAVQQVSPNYKNVTLIDYYPQGEIANKSYYLANDMIHPNQNFYQEWFKDLDSSISQDFDFTVSVKFDKS